MPSPHAIAALILTFVTFAAFASARMRIELVCLLLIAVLALGFYAFPLVHDGRYTGFEIAFGGFGHEALVAICCLMILGRGLMVTGALDPVARLMARLWRFNRTLGLLFSLLLAMGLSMFVNDTPVLVLTLPILVTLAVRIGVPASHSLMPVNCAILIGGMATTIGTSTNLLVVSIAEDLGVRRPGMFEFTPLALTAAAIALPYLWLVMPRLLPSGGAVTSVARRSYRAVLHLPQDAAPLTATLGKAVTRIGGRPHVLHVLRQGRQLAELDPSLALQSDDRLVVEGTVDELREASETLRAPLAPEPVMETVRAAAAEGRSDEQIAELVIGAESALVGRSVLQAQIADRYGIAVIGLARAAPLPLRSRHSPHAETLEAGDVLLVRGTAAQLTELERGEGALLLQGGVELPRSAKAPVALAIVAIVILLAATKSMPIALSALAGTIAMLATGTVRYERIGRALSVEVIVLVASSIALGRALVETGAADWLGGVFSLALQEAPRTVALGALMVFAAVLTNFVSNAAAAAIGTPLAVSIATNLAVPAEPFVLAVLFGCNICYVTPMAYQTNLLIMSAGGYSFRDFVRAGAPLALLMIVSLAWLLVRHYGL